MQTLITLWSALWPTLACFSAFALLVFGACLYVLRYAVRTDPERMSALDGGAEGEGKRQKVKGQKAVPLPDLIVTKCAQCGVVRCVDQRWLPVALVPLPAAYRISHGLCPACERVAYLELDKACPPKPMRYRTT